MGGAGPDTGTDEKSRQGWCLGIFFVMLVSVLWTSASVLVQYIADDVGFNQPFVLTYIGSAVMSTCVPAYLACAALGVVQNPPLRTKMEVSDGDDSGKAARGSTVTDAEGGHAENYGLVSDLATYNSCANGSGGCDVKTNVIGGAREVVNAVPLECGMPLKSHLFMFKIGLSISLMSYLAQWSYVVSLASTSMTSSTIISHSTALFAYLFNVLAKTESFTPGKTAGVALALIGAAVVGWGDRGDSESSESLWGDVAALVSSIAYGLYSTILTLRSPSDDEVSMTLVMGYMGLSNVVMFLPLLVIMGVAPGVHILSGMTFYVLQLVISKSILDDLMCGLLWARAMLLTTPTVATVGCSLTIPMAFAADFLIHGKVPNTPAVLGALMVLAGFLFVSGRQSDGGRVDTESTLVEATLQDQNRDKQQAYYYHMPDQKHLYPDCSGRGSKTAGRS